MITLVRSVRRTLVAHDEVRKGLLLALLVIMTFVTGLVDAFSFLVVGHVFVSNMTGNVVFLGFALAGAPDFSILICLLALGSFVLGSLAGGFLVSRLGHRPQHLLNLLSVATALQTLLLSVAAVLTALSGEPVSTGYRHGLIIVLGMAMGLQNATTRKLAVPDLSTTFLTWTIVGIAADSHLVGGSGSRAGHRLMAIAAMMLGALVGSLLIFYVSIVAPLVIALIIVAAITGTALVFWRTDQAAVRPS
jgi:uncharacterized membrane protein YoaK (UPF0700 family)